MIPEDYFTGFHISSVRSSGAPIYGNNSVVNGTVIIYTVPPDYELMLTDWFQTTLCIAAGEGQLVIYNTTPVLLNYLNRQLGAIDHSFNQTLTLLPAQILPAGYSIRLISTGVNVTTSAGIRGHIYRV